MSRDLPALVRRSESRVLQVLALAATMAVAILIAVVVIAWLGGV